MYPSLETFFKTNNIPVKYQKCIIFDFEQALRDNSKQSFKDYSEILIKCRVFTKVKKDKLLETADDTLKKLTFAIFPEWDYSQLVYKLIIDDVNKTIEVNAENELTKRLFNTIINF
jgi:hypothetical protein